MHFRDKIIHIGKGEMIVIPEVDEHKPVAATEWYAILFEKQDMTNKGDSEANELNRATLPRI